MLKLQQHQEYRNEVEDAEVSTHPVKQVSSLPDVAVL